MVCIMHKSSSYKAATNFGDVTGGIAGDVTGGIAEEMEQQAVVFRIRKPMGGGVNSLRSRTKPKPSSVSRRVSCADLGAGTHQGWLYTRKPRKTKWEKCYKWCVIKNTDLFVYADKMDAVAASRIYLPAFTVSEAKETKKEGAFKVHNEGTTFYFRCKTEKEKHVWMNHLSLTAIQFPYDSRGDNSVNLISGSSASSSGIDVNSGYSSRTSQAYSDIDETDSSSVCEEIIAATPVSIRPKKTSIHDTPIGLKSHMNSNLALRRMVTSIRDADLDLMGTDSDTRRQSQLRKSLASAGFSRKNSMKNKKVFVLRSKERQKQALEHELSDIEALLENVSQSNLYDFLSRYPDYQDTVVGSSTDSSASTRTTGPGTELPSMAELNINDYEVMDSAYDNRQTLTPDFDDFRLSPLKFYDTRRNSTSSNHSSGGTIFTKQKYKQTVTHM